MSRIKGLYISIDGKIDPNNSNKKCRYVVGTMKNFNELLTGDENKMCSEDHLNNELRILYNNCSTEPKNKFVSRYVENTEINGPVIILKKNGDIKSDAHKTLGKNVLRKVDWLGFTI
ncbi:hypothetical protein C1645_830879 [Glomus cerebriforme]|uniref:Uncharacterized protein n=1 Tax=Glomus cerebriforme TaxID=658196 RepID=A0A397SID0_9GLOM|nr:hypothetical protein C1645_830879 [Glomus cerebriforme]